MALSAKRLFPPKLDYGNLQTFDVSGQVPIALPEGKALVYAPPSNRPNTSFTGAGITALYKNSSERAEFARSGNCYSATAIRVYSQATMGGKVMGSWTEQDCENFVNDMFNNYSSSAFRYFTSQMQEAYGADEPYAIHSGTNQKFWIERRIAAKLAVYKPDPNGAIVPGYYFGPYDGAPRLQSISEDLGNVDMFREGLSDPAKALVLCRQASDNNYFTHTYEYGHGLIKAYADGASNWKLFLLRNILNLKYWKLGMTALGVNDKKVMTFGWFGECQPIQGNDWGVRYRMPAPNGYYEIGRVGQWNPHAQLALALIAYLYGDMLLCWESGARTGSDSTYHRPPGSGLGNDSKYVGTGGIQYAQDGPAEYVSNRPVCYADGPKGYQDLPLVASKWVSMMNQWAGWGNITECPARVAGSTTAFVAATPTYVIDQYQQNRPWCIFGSNNSKGWLVVIDFSAAAGQARSYEVETPLGNVTVQTTTGTSRCFVLANETSDTVSGSPTPVGTNFTEGQTLYTVSSSEVIKAYKTGSTWFAASSNTGLNYKHRSYLTSKAGLTATQAAVFTDDYPFTVSNTATCSAYVDGQFLFDFDNKNESAYARRHTDGTLYAEAIYNPNGDRSFKSPTWLSAASSGFPASCFASSDPRVSTPPVVTPPTDNTPVTGSTAFVKHNLTTKRWFGLCTFPDNVNPSGQLYEPENQMVDRSVANGANFVSPVMRWEALEPTKGNYDWRLLDRYLQKCADLNIMLFPRLELSRVANESSLDDFMPDAERQRTYDGSVGTFSNRTNGAFDSDIMKTRHRALVLAFLDHAAASPHAARLMGLSFTNEARYEGQYASMKKSTTTPPYYEAGLFDYSAPALAKFRQRLASWYNNNINALNTTWGDGANYTSFDQITIPVPPQVSPGDPQGIDRYWNTRPAQDFYKHRVTALAEWTNYYASIVKTYSSNLATMTEVGSAVDGESGARGTWGLPLLTTTDGFKQNSSPTRPIEWIRASSHSGGRHTWTADEIFGSDLNDSPGAVADHGLRAWEGGNSLLTFAGYMIPGVDGPSHPRWNESLSRFDQIMAGVKNGVNGRAGVAAGSSFTPPTYTGTQTMALSVITQAGGPQNRTYAQDWSNANPKPNVVYSIDY